MVIGLVIKLRKGTSTNMKKVKKGGGFYIAMLTSRPAPLYNVADYRFKRRRSKVTRFTHKVDSAADENEAKYKDRPAAKNNSSPPRLKLHGACGAALANEAWECCINSGLYS